MFYVGQKVVCVDDTGFTQMLTKGREYTISYTADMPRWVCVAGVGQWFVGSPPGWEPSRFRPAVERKTSIEIFTRMLNPSKERETVT